ncbi:MAG: YqeG family HAD IIIA-type phosphatase [Clostridia bacterium]|nr:YqeG family HAD IIIA-type phosphatase [Clostridia bacterium]
MLKYLVPDMAVDNIHEINLDALKNKGIKGVILDIDNTLESHKTPKPSQKTLEFLKKLEENGFKICLISNGREERVKLFNEDLSYFALAKAGKPTKRGYLAGMKSMNLTQGETAMIGDQLFTDVFGAKRCKMYAILVTPIESIENGFFYIKRFFENIIKRKMMKNTNGEEK